MDPKLRQRTLITALIGFAMYGAVFVRFYASYWSTPDRNVMLTVLLVYGVLLAVSYFLGYRLGGWMHALILAQLLAIFVLFFYPMNESDFFGILVIPICGDITFRFPPRTAYRWVAAALIWLGVDIFLNFDLFEAVPYWLTYLAASLFIVAYVRVTLQAEEAQARSEALLDELTSAHKQLQVYAAQAEELATVQERNRLARELHDSVTQTIFSITLTAQAARILLERDTQKAAAQLERLQELAGNALAEMRSLIEHLRPKTVAEHGLVPALREFISERERQDGLHVDLQVDGERRLPVEMEEALFRVIQEALQNVIKHAGTQQASVRLNLGTDPVSAVVEDHGQGFDPQTQAASPGHMGLASMAGRIQALGGTFAIDSAPGKGTRVRVDGLAARVKEKSHA